MRRLLNAAHGGSRPPLTPTQSRSGPPTLPAFDPDRPWDLHPQVSVRPEPFGALLYHFGTRRLSFLKDPALLRAVRALGDEPSARAACDSAGIGADQQPAFEAALAVLARTRMIVPRDQETSPSGPAGPRPETGDPP